MSEEIGIWDRLLIRDGSRVVDVGFGSSADLINLSRIVGETGFVFGIERSRKLVKKIAAGLVDVKNVRLLVGHAGRLQIPEGSVDVVLFKAVLHEVEDISQALSEARRVCRSNGMIIIVDFSAFPAEWLKGSNRKWKIHHPWKLFGSSPDKHPGFNKDQIRSLLETAGLREDRYEDDVSKGRFYGHPVPMFLAASTVQK